MRQRFFAAGSVLMAVLLSSCTMQEVDPPDLAGPSEFGTSIVVQTIPDVLQQDGASQSLITITARDPNGQPVRNVSLRAEIRVDGVPTDFGTISARNLVTGSDGRATLVYTAPVSPSIGVDTFTIVDIVVTPIGSDFNNSAPRLASIRLVPPGVVVPPAGLDPYFSFNPTTAADHEPIVFTACNDLARPCAPANNPIASLRWDFGDGETANGTQVTHAYDTPGTFVVRFTITDAIGRSASTTQTITIEAGADPTGTFSVSPNNPLPGQLVSFNALAVRAAPGRRIVSYVWDMGDGSPNKSGISITHTYPLVGNYSVTLVATDDVGRRLVVSREVQVAFPDEGFTVAGATKKKGW
jgi:hypothetical protein